MAVFTELVDSDTLLTTLNQSVISASSAATATLADMDYDSDYSSSSGFPTYWKVSVPTASLDFLDKEGVASIPNRNWI